MSVEVHSICLDELGSELSRRRIYGMAYSLHYNSDEWSVIDSFSSVTGRYKGDPIPSVWDEEADVGVNNSWIVIQQNNPPSGYPAMEMKIQGIGSTGTFNDVSGTGYAHEGETNTQDLYIRFSTIGGWDLEDTQPDFANPNKASDNRRVAAGHAGSGFYHSDLLVLDSDFILWLSWAVNSKQLANVVAYFGDYVPKTASQYSAASPARFILSDDSGIHVNPVGRDYQAFLKEQPGTTTIIGCLDENGVWQDWDYSCNAMYSWLQGDSQPNEWASDPTFDAFEVVIRGIGSGGTPPGYDDRVIGSLKHVRAGFGMGPMVQFSEREWCCAGYGHGIVFPWDGSTDFV